MHTVTYYIYNIYYVKKPVKCHRKRDDTLRKHNTDWQHGLEIAWNNSWNALSEVVDSILCHIQSFQNSYLSNSVNEWFSLVFLSENALYQRLFDIQLHTLITTIINFKIAKYFLKYLIKKYRTLFFPWLGLLQLDKPLKWWLNESFRKHNNTIKWTWTWT